MNKVKIRPPVIRLKDVLQLVDAAQSGGHAKQRILAQEVSVNGEICTVIHKQMRAGDRFTVDGEVYEITYED